MLYVVKGDDGSSDAGCWECIVRARSISHATEKVDAHLIVVGRADLISTDYVVEVQRRV